MELQPKLAFHFWMLQGGEACGWAAEGQSSLLPDAAAAQPHLPLISGPENVREAALLFSL